MKMKLSVLLVFLIISFGADAQGFTFSDYGAISKQEIELKQCPFDKDADAVVIMHEALSNYDEEYHLVTDHHIRIKILNSNGIDNANVKILYRKKKDFERISRVEGMTINIGASGELTKQKLDKKSIYDQKLNDRWGEMTFAFPSVKAGSIIEYKYRSTMTHYGGLDEWEFQDELPVMNSRYMLYIVPNAEFAYSVNKREDLPITITPNNTEGGIYFEMNNIPALIDEPYMEAREDYLQKVVFQLSGYHTRDDEEKKYMNSWDDVIKELLKDENFGSQLGKNVSGGSDFLKQLTGMTAVQKMQFIHDYVRKNINWNDLYSIYSMEGVKSTWQKRQGTSGEVNMLLINLLKDAGLQTYPVLVSERFHGKVRTGYPFIDQFNNVFAYVLIDNKKYFLDATDHFTPAHIIPYDILGTTALLVDSKQGGLITINNEALQYDDKIYTEMDIKEDGTFTGKVTVTSKDYAKIMRARNYKQHKEDFLKNYFHKDGNILSISDFEIEQIENDSMPLEQHGTFTGNPNSTEGYAYIPLDLFSGIYKNPFLADERFSNINFGYKRTINLLTSVSIPKNYLVDVLPASQKIVNTEKDISINRQVEYNKEKNIVYCTIQVEFKNALYQANSYPVLKKFYKKMFDLLKEPLVLKKK